MIIRRSRLLVALTAIALGCGSEVTTSPPDASAPVDVAQTTDTSTQTTCLLPRGGTCPVGSTCPAGDGCNNCSCSTLSEFAMCTARPCAADASEATDATVDAGPAGCRASTDCGPDQMCNFNAAGCGLRGVCGAITDCAAIVAYCSCTGETFMDCPGGATRAWVSRGACASDAGAPGDGG